MINFIPYAITICKIFPQVGFNENFDYETSQLVTFKPSELIFAINIFPAKGINSLSQGRRTDSVTLQFTYYIACKLHIGWARNCTKYKKEFLRN